MFRFSVRVTEGRSELLLYTGFDLKVTGSEFGENQGKFYIVSRALYGLCIAGASFRSFLSRKLNEIGFKLCLADPDVWHRLAIENDGTEWYEYVMGYVDDLIAVSKNARDVLKKIEGIDGEIKYKNDQIGPPSDYLGAKLKFRVVDGAGRWVISSEKYVEAAIKNAEEICKKKDKYVLPKSPLTSMCTSFMPELDGSAELDTDETT